MSSGENDSGLAITGVLSFPPGADLSVDTTNNGEDSAEDKPVKGGSEVAVIEDAVLVASVNGTSGQEFGPVPDEVWGSDHLALGVEVAFV